MLRYLKNRHKRDFDEKAKEYQKHKNQTCGYARLSAVRSGSL